MSVDADLILKYPSLIENRYIMFIVISLTSHLNLQKDPL